MQYGVPRDIMLAVYNRENGRCFYCDVVVSLAARKWLQSNHPRARVLNAATFDHIIPRSRGGADSVDNGVCACVSCNEARGDRPAVDFLYERAQRAVA